MQPTTTLCKISALRRRIKVIQGGQGAGKTFAILLILINHANANPNKEIFIVSAELTKMRITVIKDFVNIMKLLGIYSDERMLGGTIYRFPNGSFIKFLGLDKADLGKGLRSDVVFLNEANKVDFETYRELTSRAEQVILDFNPNARFWVHDEVITRQDADFIKVTYKDNEFLSPTEIAEIELYKSKGYDEQGNEINAYWANKWRVYGLGLEGRVDGVIYQNWELGEFDNTLPIIYGMDFGFKDPFSLVKCAFDSKLMRLYLKEEIYKSGLDSNQIIELLNTKITNKNNLIIADSADPTMIRTIENDGFNIIGLGKEKIVNGIRSLQKWQMVVDESSTNLINELHNYVWMDKAGEIPIDGQNHQLDPIRYVEKYWRYQNL
jgi:phage terminase large subunit